MNQGRCENMFSVLPEDIKLAKALYECCYSCLNRAQLELNQENLDEADRWVQEFQRCKRDLDKLIDRKKQFDNMKKVAKVFHKNNVDIDSFLRVGEIN